jgi:hypothetical protein
MDEIETLKVEPWHTSQGDHVIINKSDFDPDKHTLINQPDKKRGRPTKTKESCDRSDT